ncbi:AAA family ATPase [Actinoplanes sp. CA-030573]|uniref:AAA family ATPase n=1 Tax=Actinoplanes sp. CA-030573 TaxID=3239898 RepID=UPI003D8ACE28
MERLLMELSVENFRSLRRMTVPVEPLNVLVRPSGAGKTNLLEVFWFLADVINTDLQPAIDLRGGFSEVVFWRGDKRKPPTRIHMKLKATWTTNSSTSAPDGYLLRIGHTDRGLTRRGSFQSKRTRGGGRRIAITGQKVSVVDSGADAGHQQMGINAFSSGLAALPRLSEDRGGTEVTTVARQLASFRVFDVAVNAARQPSLFVRRSFEALDDDAANLAGFLLLEAFCPGMSGRIVEINDQVRLRGASQQNLSARVSKLASLVRARAAREGTDLACVFVREDLDRVDGSEYDAAPARVQAALAKEFGSLHYVLSVWEIEACLLLFPDALTGGMKSWKAPAQYRDRDTGTLSDPKKILKHKFGGAPRRYRESDAPEVLAQAVALACVHRPEGTNRSWQQLHTDAVECCRAHLSSRGRAR